VRPTDRLDAQTAASATDAGGRQAPPAPPRLLQMVLYGMVAKTVYAAAELGLADLLAEGPRTTAELAELTGAHGPSLRRLLLALAGLGLVTQTGTDGFPPPPPTGSSSPTSRGHCARTPRTPSATWCG
jgi:hypothetical protein